MVLRKVILSIFSLLLIAVPLRTVQSNELINGAGATFPYPIYSKWFDDYHNINPDIRINYQSIGSGGGIRQFMARVIDFGATDDPMSDRDISKVNGNVFHIPTVLGGVVPAFNLEGIEHLNFSGDILAGIFLGEIQYWNDSSIKKLNPGVKLPREKIVPIHRSDGSGTTFCFTDYLASASPTWKRKVGRGQSVNWPGGIGAKGNEGVTGMVQQFPYSIGYVELVYAKKNNLSYGAVQNKAGQFVKADVDSVGAAAAAVEMPVDYRVSIVNAPGEKAYPISTYTWMLVSKKYDSKNGLVLKNFLGWMLTEGQTAAAALDYSPLPDNVIQRVKQTVDQIQFQ